MNKDRKRKENVETNKKMYKKARNIPVLLYCEIQV